MEHLSSAMEQQNQLQWRRHKVQELCSKGYSQREISQVFLFRIFPILYLSAFPLVLFAAFYQMLFQVFHFYNVFQYLFQ